MPLLGTMKASTTPGIQNLMTLAVLTPSSLVPSTTTLVMTTMTTKMYMLMINPSRPLVGAISREVTTKMNTPIWILSSVLVTTTALTLDYARQKTRNML